MLGCGGGVCSSLVWGMARGVWGGIASSLANDLLQRAKRFKANCSIILLRCNEIGMGAQNLHTASDICLCDFFFICTLGGDEQVLDCEWLAVTAQDSQAI